MKRAIATCAILLLLTGCGTKPKVQTPKAHVPAGWNEPVAHGVVVDSTAVREWWKTFQDPTLDTLVERAGRANLDLRLQPNV